jgi:hypothetical protein
MLDWPFVSPDPCDTVSQFAPLAVRPARSSPRSQADVLHISVIPLPAGFEFLLMLNVRPLS